MPRIKTEAQLGPKEYKPRKTYAPPKVDKETTDNWEANYLKLLVERIKMFKPVQGKAIMPQFVTFNNNLDKPEWFWNDTAFRESGIWTVRDLAVLLENSKNK